MKNNWISVEEKRPELIAGENYSKNVLAVLNGQLAVMTYCWNPDEDSAGYFWGNCYGNIDGESEWDDEYKPTHWQPLPEPPIT